MRSCTPDSQRAAVAADPSAHRHEFITGSPRLHCVRWGAGGRPTMLLLHGSTLHARSWDGLAQALDGYAATALDFHGHGRSEWDGEYSPESYVEDVERAVEASGETSLVLVGHSMGSLVAMRYAAEQPTRVRAAVFIDIDPRVPDMQIETLHNAGQRPGRTFETREEARDRVVGMNDDPGEPILERLLQANFLTDDDGRYVECYDRRTLAQFARWDNTALLPRISCPALVVRGEHSIVHSPEAARAAVAALPDARLCEITGTGADHMLHVKRPADVATAIRGFVDGLGPAT